MNTLTAQILSHQEIILPSDSLIQTNIFVLCMEYLNHRREAILWITEIQKENPKKEIYQDLIKSVY